MNKTPSIHNDCTHCNAKVHSIFHTLDLDQLKELNEHKSCAIYKKGQYIFTENGIPQGLYCVNFGKVKLTTIGVDGKEQILRLSREGDVLGYRSLISNERYHCSAIALDNCSICIIDKTYFHELIKSNSKLLFEIVKKMSNDLKMAEEHIVSLSQKNVRERMAEALLFIKTVYGFAEDGKTINVSLTREEIADYVGTSTESAIRLLSEFNQDKLIELSGRKIQILNLPKLIMTANLDH